jgi:hypothetical protein
MASRGAFSAERSAEPVFVSVRSPGIDSDGLGIDSWFTNKQGVTQPPTSRYSTGYTKARMRKARPYPLINTITRQKNTIQPSLTEFLAMNQTEIMKHICFIVLKCFKLYYFTYFSQRMQRRASTFLMEWNTWVKYFNLNILQFCIFCKVEHSL